MDREQSWQVIEQERLRLADMLDTLTDDEWDHPSLCAGWRVRDVAAHVALGAQPPGLLAMAGWAVRARGSFHRMNHDVSVAHADSGADLAAELRTHASSRRLPPGTNHRNILYDTIVHAQDIAIPLHRTHPVPPEAAKTAADRVWAMGRPFRARRRFAEYRLIADDVYWQAGAGQQVICGPIDALLLLLTGRSAALARLKGPGVAALTAARNEV